MAASRFNIVIRSFSTSTAQQQMVKTPVQVFGIGGRYATALYSAAMKANEIDKIENELEGVQKALNSDKRFRDFIKDPTVKRSIKANALKMASAKFNVSKSTSNALTLIAENGRLKNLDQIVNAFKTIMAAHRGEVVCEVISAEPLDEASMSEIQGVLKQFNKKGGQIIVTKKVDPKIIGGLIVTIGDKYIDMSIATKFKKYSDLVKSSV